MRINTIARPSDFPLVEHRRAELILSRVRMVAFTFAVLTPLWIAVDFFFYPWPLWGFLAGLRLVATASFGMIGVLARPSTDIRKARLLLWTLMVVPMLFFIASNPLMGRYQIEGVAEAVSMGYVFLPFVIMAGISIFPISVQETVGFVLTTMTVMGGAVFMGTHLLPFNSYLGALWLLALIGGVSGFAALSQLHFIQQLVRRASQDPLTGVFNRSSGIELLQMHFAEAQRERLPLAVAFIDLDDFKEINDRYGHEDGDEALRQATKQMQGTIRHSDVLIRWGGEEFVILMPRTAHDNAIVPLRRVMNQGLGMRPDEHTLTASIGLAELMQDRCGSWNALVDLADARMYRAKQAGKNRLLTADDMAFLPDPDAPTPG